MTNLSGWLDCAGIFKSEAPKSPWGGGGGGSGNGGGSGGGNGGGPRNPWSLPPDGRPRSGRPRSTNLRSSVRRRRRRWRLARHSVRQPAKDAGDRRPDRAVWVGFTSIHPIGPQRTRRRHHARPLFRTLTPGVRADPARALRSSSPRSTCRISAPRISPAGGENLMLTGDQNIIDLPIRCAGTSATQDYMFQIRTRGHRPRHRRKRDAPGRRDDDARRSDRRGPLADRGPGPGDDAAILDEYNSGIRIQGVAIKQAARRSRWTRTSRQVTAAQQDRAGNIKNLARAYAQQVRPRRRVKRPSSTRSMSSTSLHPR
jgi:membrane protease subunit HflK